MPKYLLTCLLTYRSYRPTQRQVLEVFEKCFFFNFVPKVWVCSPCSSSGYATVKHCIRRAIVSSPREIKQISLTVAAIYNYIFHVSNVTGLLGTQAIHNSSQRLGARLSTTVGLRLDVNAHYRWDGLIGLKSNAVIMLSNLKARDIVQTVHFTSCRVDQKPDRWVWLPTSLKFLFSRYILRFLSQFTAVCTENISVNETLEMQDRKCGRV